MLFLFLPFFSFDIFLVQPTKLLNNAEKMRYLFIFLFTFTELSHLKYEIISSKRRRRRRITITAGWAAEGSEACGSKNDSKIVLEEGEHMEYLYSLLVFALFEDVMLSCCETAGEESEANVTCGYGYSPPSCSGKRQSRARRRSLEIISIY